MNDLLERFFELESRQRLMVCAVAVVLVFGVYWHFVYSSRRAETVDMVAKITDLRSERDTKQKLVANISKVQEVVRELGAQLKQAEARLPDSKEIPDLLSSV